MWFQLANIRLTIRYKAFNATRRRQRSCLQAILCNWRCLIYPCFVGSNPCGSRSKESSNKDSFVQPVKVRPAVGEADDPASRQIPVGATVRLAVAGRGVGKRVSAVAAELVETAFLTHLVPSAAVTIHPGVAG